MVPPALESELPRRSSFKLHDPRSPAITPSQLLQSFEQQSPSPRPVFIELCSGSARLSYFCKSAGCHCVPIDHSRNVHRNLVPTIILDLSDRAQAQIVIDLLKSGNVALIHAGVPCGTCSRAREIPLKSGRPGPPPLRSQEFLFGLPGLSDVDQLKVTKANSIYSNVADIIDEAISLGVLVQIENPKNSWLWQMPRYASLLERGFFDTVFQHCRWNPDTLPSRPKWTKLRSNISELSEMEGSCNRKHVHLGWGQHASGQFATADEAEYQEALCEEWIKPLTRALQRRGWKLCPEPINPDISDCTPHKRRRAAMGRQPRGRNIPAVISEFESVCTLTSLATPPAEKSFKILRQSVDAGGSVPQETVIGTFRSPQEFLEAAKSAHHPADIQGAVPDNLCWAVKNMLESSPASYVQRLLKGVREIAKLVEDNRELDKKALEKTDPHGAKVLLGKKLHTGADLINKISFPDANLADDLLHGFPITGMQPFSGVFEHEVKLPQTSVQQLRQNSVVSNAATMSRVKSSGNSKVDSERWNSCEEEAKSNWLLGPVYSCEELLQFTISYPHLSRRFGLVQGLKTRPIDDLSETGINGSFGSQDRIQFLDADSMCALIRLIESILCDGVDSITLRSSTVISVKVHREWLSVPSAKHWFGKNFDLSKAYKQLIIRPEDRWAAAIATWNHKLGKCALFSEVTLPFGASGAVLGFNRASTFLWAVGVQVLGVLWTSFYDDFPAFAPQCVCASTRTAVELMFKLLGWTIASDAAKALDFAEAFTSLGIVFRVGRLILKDSTVSSKPERVNSVVAEFSDILAEGVFTPVQSDSLQGKVQFMENSIYGKAGRSVASIFQRRNRQSFEVTVRDAQLIRWLCEWLTKAAPRNISSKYVGPPVLLFSDGACEFAASTRVLTFGGLLYDPRDGALLYFGSHVCMELEAEWAETGKAQLVTEAELLPQLIARRLWPERIRGANVLSFIDSEPAKFSCIKGSSDAPC